MSCNKQCPNCNSRELFTSYSLLLTLTGWPLALGFAGTIIVAGEVLGLAQLVSIKFALLAIFPLFFRLLSKLTCIRCGTQTPLVSGQLLENQK